MIFFLGNCSTEGSEGGFVAEEKSLGHSTLQG